MPPVLEAPRLIEEKITSLDAPPAPAAKEDESKGGAEFFILDGVSWETYESLMADYANRSGPQFTYDRGTLQIMSPLSKHEKPHVRLSLSIENVTEVWGMEVENYGGMTFKLKDQERGWEPDACFYVQNADWVAEREEVDMEKGDPPPDLTIEVDETHSSIPRLPLFAAFGVPEVWRVMQQQKVLIYVLDTSAGTYRESEQSVVLPLLTAAVLSDFLAKGKTLRRLAWLKAVRRWAHQAGQDPADVTPAT